jgi:hypothetical protein
MKIRTLALLIHLALCATASSITPTLQRLYSPSSSGSFGWCLAGHENWLLVGNPSDTANTLGSGSVSVFSPTTGKMLRQLFAADEDFGYSVAVRGSTAIVGAPNTAGTGPGAAYVMDVSTGKQLFKLTATDGVTGDFFGGAVAIHGDRILVSSVKRNNQRGAVYVFDATTGLQLLKLEADDAANGDEFGYSIALNGNLALIGAIGVDDPVSNAGAAYVYDITAGTKLRRMLATSTEIRTSAKLGTAVAISGRYGLVGSPGYHASRGSVHVFDLLTGAQVSFLQPTDSSSSSEFGNSVAVSGRLALVGCHKDDDDFTNAGSAYLFDVASGSELQKIVVNELQASLLFGNKVTFAGSSIGISNLGGTPSCYHFSGLYAPLSFDTLAKKSDYAPGLKAGNFSSFSSLQINAEGETMVQAKLSDVPSTSSNALFNTLSGRHDLVMRTGVGALADDGETVTALTLPQLQHPGTTVFQLKMKGSYGAVPVTSANDVLVFSDNGTTVQQLLREGDTLNVGGFTGQVIKSLGAQASSTTDQLVSVFSTLTADSTADSAVILHNIASNGVADSVREGAASPFALINYGQVTHRVSMTGSEALVSTALTGDTAQNAVVIRLGTMGPDVAVARKGDAAPGTTGFFSSFIGEGSNALNQPIIRASLSGVSSNVNEGLWANRGASLGLVAQKGTQVTGLDSGVLFSSFIRAWMLPADRVLFLAKLKGTGVKTSNDCALFLALPDGSLHAMMREGDYAPDGQGAKIGSISQVDVDEVNAAYAIIASLSDSASSSNQALFVGDADIDPASGHEEVLRPRMILRKGSYQGQFGSTSALSSIKVLLPTESTGIGSRGLGGAIGGYRVAVQLTFSNKSVMIGTVE